MLYLGLLFEAISANRESLVSELLETDLMALRRD